jgi:hypothetical protein
MLVVDFCQKGSDFDSSRSCPSRQKSFGYSNLKAVSGNNKPQGNREKKKKKKASKSILGTPQQQAGTTKTVPSPLYKGRELLAQVMESCSDKVRYSFLNPTYFDRDSRDEILRLLIDDEVAQANLECAQISCPGRTQNKSWSH